MKDLKHTKGTWRSSMMNVFVELTNPAELKVVASAIDGPHTANWHTIDEETEANAMLISAAPDMLKVLMSMENDNNEISKEIWEMRNKAVHKAINGDEPEYLKINK